MSQAEARRYDSPLRDEQTQRTRERVVDAVVAELADGEGELTVPAVARRARVSLRTVYRHFPTKQELVEAVARRFQERFGAPYFASPEELPHATERMVRAFAEDEQLVRATLRIDPSLLGEERSARLAALEQTLGPLLADRTPAERRQIVGVVYAVHGLLMWRNLRTYVGLDDQEASAAVAWATETILAGLTQQAQTNERKA
jgi:AcrR family transcriptional regulator